MQSLTALKCTPCRGDEPAISDDKIIELAPKVPNWEIAKKDGSKRLERTFKFDDFAQALAFTNGVGEIAEEEGHHPLIETGWGSVKVSWWTHEISGLHRNDFIMAAKTDEVYVDQSEDNQTKK